MRRLCQILLIANVVLTSPALLFGEEPPSSERYRRMKSYLDAIPAIDTHDHLLPFAQLRNLIQTSQGPGVNLAAVLQRSYYTWTNPLTPWQPSESFREWWDKSKDDFVNARATSFYRYQLPAFQDLYGVDFDAITPEQAEQLNRRIFDNYKNRKWLYEVITEKANIELIVNDPYWARLDEKPDYPFCALVFNVTSLVWGQHSSPFKNPHDNPYEFAKRIGLRVNSLDDYLTLLDRLFQERKKAGAVCLKTTLAYNRTLRFENVSKDRAEAAFGRKPEEVSPQQSKDFEDFIMWRLVELAGKYDIPFQIHTGQARIQGSNPMLLVDLIDANPKTKFILFHGGYPWVDDTGVIAMKYPNRVWIDSCWLPTLSYHMAKRAYHEWLDAVPSNHILWGADCNHAEGVYGATEFTRRCLAEVLTERVERGELREEHAQRIGRQILRDNALELFPSLKDMLWKEKKGKLTAPANEPSSSKPQKPAEEH